MLYRQDASLTQGPPRDA